VIVQVLKPGVNGADELWFCLAELEVPGAFEVCNSVVLSRAQGRPPVLFVAARDVAIDTPVVSLGLAARDVAIAAVGRELNRAPHELPRHPFKTAKQIHYDTAG
jgi:hypothetical protein